MPDPDLLAQLRAQLANAISLREDREADVLEILNLIQKELDGQQSLPLPEPPSNEPPNAHLDFPNAVDGRVVDRWGRSWLARDPDRLEEIVESRYSEPGWLSAYDGYPALCRLPDNCRGIIWSFVCDSEILDKPNHGTHYFNICSNLAWAAPRPGHPGATAQLRLDFNRFGSTPRVVIHSRRADGASTWPTSEPVLNLGSSSPIDSPIGAGVVNYMRVSWELTGGKTPAGTSARLRGRVYPPPPPRLGLICELNGVKTSRTVAPMNPKAGPFRYFGPGHIEGNGGVIRFKIEEFLT